MITRKHITNISGLITKELTYSLKLIASEITGIAITDFDNLSRKRDQNLIIARYMIIRYLAEHSQLTNRAIGQIFEKPYNHSTVYYANKQFTNWCETEEKTANLYEEFKDKANDLFNREPEIDLDEIIKESFRHTHSFYYAI